MFISQVRSENFYGSGIKTLVIQRGSTRNEKNIFELNEEETKKTIDNQPKDSASRIVREGPIFGIVGFMYLKSEEFICVVKDVDEAGFVCKPNDKIKNQSEGKRYGIYKIKEVKFYPMTPPQGSN